MSVLHGKSKEIVELCKILGLPEYTRRFTLNAEVDSIATIDCEYFPTKEDMERGNVFFKKYELHEIPQEEKEIEQC